LYSEEQKEQVTDIYQSYNIIEGAIITET